MKTGLCYHCNLPIEGRKHLHEGECRIANTAKQARQRQAVKRTQAAALNGGRELGRHNKELATRLSKLTLRSYGEVGRMLGMSAEGVRIVELRALAKLRALLLPFKNTQTGAEKVRVVTCPIPSL